MRVKLGAAFLLIIWAVLVAGCGSYANPGDEPEPKENISVPDFMARADELFKRREDLKNIREGIELLRRVRHAERRNYEAAWKLSRFYYYLGRYSPEDREKAQALKDGIEAGQVATRIEIRKPEGHFWLGANWGERAKQNPLTGVAMLDNIREEMNEVIALDPAYEGAGAYDVLAQIELQTDLYGGSSDKAAEYLEKAIALEKNNSYLHLHLAEAYLQLKRETEAKQQLQTVLTMQPDPDHEFEHREAVAEAKRTLRNRF